MDDRTAQMWELMMKESNRLKTFQMNPPWPKDYVDIKKLAKAGFFYAFNEDTVHCAFCRGQVSRWDRDDDPMTEHARHFVTCPFIMGGEVGNEPIGEDPIPGPKRPRPYDVCGSYPNFPPDDPRYEQEQQSLQTNEPSDDQQIDHPQQSQSQQPHHPHDFIRQSHEIQLPHSLVPAVTLPSEALLNPQSQYVIQPAHQNRAQPLPLLHRLPPMEPQLPMNNRNQARNHLIYQQLLRNPEYSLQPQRLPITGNQDQSSSNSSNNLNGICKICYTNAIELVFLPCGHSVSCLMCSQRLSNCPFCRETIITRIRTYLV